MHKDKTDPLLVHFKAPERAGLQGFRGETAKNTGKAPSETLVVRKAVNMFLDDPKLRRRLLRAIQEEMVPQ